MAYGKELILDLSGCNNAIFNRKDIEEWLKRLCELINMEREDLHWWDCQDVPEDEKPTEIHLVGISAVQFITTSDIVIHTLDLVSECYINIFSCKDFDALAAADFTKEWFDADHFCLSVIKRGKNSKCQNVE